ncbi:MAG TPA: radical SAM family heme chaperone HemW [Vicinamibacterales bacterium]
MASLQSAINPPSAIRSPQSIGVYIHVPFCASICGYCNFNRGLFDAALKARYVEALEAEIGRAGDGSPADTIFFGGGTPSLLEPDEIHRLVAACRGAFALDPDAEITLEANPESVSIARLAAYRAAGVTRVSFGVQSLHDDELARLDRRHTAARAKAAIADARQAGFDNVSLDLMLWLPQQTMAAWRATVEQAIALGPDHVSLYLLELYPNAPLREAMARAQWSLAPDDEAADMYLWAMDRFDAAGFAQYEISNVARPGRRSRHNLKYWQDGAWIGFGCGAHSTRGAWRWRNVASTTDYVARIRRGDDVAAERRRRSVEEQAGDALFTGLRLTEGVDFDAVGARYGLDLWSRYAGELERQRLGGRVEIDGHRVRLTRPGMLVANDVMALFV